jgi:YebC/PmpR family DNA-binding regulatory protein
MSGHSKWHKIQHRKEQVEGKKSKLFARLSRDIKIAARDGINPDTNPSLRDAIERAKKANVPYENIDRILNRDMSKLQPVMYEGYSAEGVALLISCETENPNRAVAEVRAILKDHGGSLGGPNSVRWQFARGANAPFEAVPAHQQKLAEAEATAVQALVAELLEADDVVAVYTTLA